MRFRALPALAYLFLLVAIFFVAGGSVLVPAAILLHQSVLPPVLDDITDAVAHAVTTSVMIATLPRVAPPAVVATMRRKPSRMQFIAGIGVGIGFIMGTTILLQIAPGIVLTETASASHSTYNAASIPEFLLSLANAAALAPILEELVMRLYLFQLLKTWISVWPAAIVS